MAQNTLRDCGVIKVQSIASPGCTSPAAGMGGFTLSICKSLAVGPLHRADDGAA